MPETNLDALRRSLETVIDPVLGLSLGEAKMIRDVVDNDGKTTVAIDLPIPGYPAREQLESAITTAAETEIVVAFDEQIRGKNTGGNIGLTVRNVLAVGSGKGGVGKSTVATGIALGLKNMGAKVGLMDADVYGPSLPHLLGADGEPVGEEITLPDGKTIQRMLPTLVGPEDDPNPLKLISMGFFVQEDQAVVWRGPMLHRALTQFLQDTHWGDLDYLIIDLPPGTGDVSLTLSQLLGLAGAVVVCTPQQVALLDAVKAISMYGQLNVPVLGLVENISGEMFGRGGARTKAGELGIPFLGEIPADAHLRELGDAGRMGDLFAGDDSSREAMEHVCLQTAIQIAKSVLTTTEIPQLEVL